MARTAYDSSACLHSYSRSFATRWHLLPETAFFGIIPSPVKPPFITIAITRGLKLPFTMQCIHFTQSQQL